MKYHKIKNIPFDVCTAEQKIAYNLAFSNYALFEKQYHALPMHFQKRDLISYAAHKMIEWYQNGYTYDGKYDIDAIFSALNAGFENYLCGDCHILESYEDIGNMYPASYMSKEEKI